MPIDSSPSASATCAASAPVVAATARRRSRSGTTHSAGPVSGSRSPAYRSSALVRCRRASRGSPAASARAANRTSCANRSRSIQASGRQSAYASPCRRTQSSARPALARHWRRLETATWRLRRPETRVASGHRSAIRVSRCRARPCCNASTISSERARGRSPRQVTTRPSTLRSNRPRQLSRRPRSGRASAASAGGLAGDAIRSRSGDRTSAIGSGDPDAEPGIPARHRVCLGSGDEVRRRDDQQPVRPGAQDRGSEFVGTVQGQPEQVRGGVGDLGRLGTGPGEGGPERQGQQAGTPVITLVVAGLDPLGSGGDPLRRRLDPEQRGRLPPAGQPGEPRQALDVGGQHDLLEGAGRIG